MEHFTIQKFYGILHKQVLLSVFHSLVVFLEKCTRSWGFEWYFPTFCLLCFFSWSFTNVLQIFVDGLISAKQCKTAKDNIKCFVPLISLPWTGKTDHNPSNRGTASPGMDSRQESKQDNHKTGLGGSSIARTTRAHISEKAIFEEPWEVGWAKLMVILEKQSPGVSVIDSKFPRLKVTGHHSRGSKSGMTVEKQRISPS